MVVPTEVRGLSAFLSEVKKHEGKCVFVLFVGANDPSTGKSWCPDCVKAEPVIEKGLEIASEDAIFILCDVGGRDEWKNPENEFRKHSDLKLTSVPTLMKWGTTKRLSDDDVKEDLVKMLFQG